MRAYDRRGSTTLLGADGVTRRLDGSSADLCRATLDFLTEPATREELIQHLAGLAGVGPDDVPVAPVDALIALLAAAGALVVDSSRSGSGSGSGARPRGRVVLGVTGAVAAIDAPQLARALLARGHTVRAALTRHARRFVTPTAMRAILHGGVYTSMFRGDATCPVPHVNLAEWADLVVVAPASATTIARLAAADHGELVAAVALGTTAPVVIAPSMNQAMIRSPGVRRNLDRLRDDGFAVLHSALGVEVAHAPESRRPMLGPAPPPAAIADQIDHILVETFAARVPAPPDEWERAWASTPPEQLPWHTTTLDPDLAGALDRLAAAGPRRLLDLGCGDGTAAIEAARRGFQVVALDLAASALAQARHRAGALPITWIQDDATQPRLWGAFDVLLDRGLLHVLPIERRSAYAAALARLAAPGASLLIKTHAPAEGATHRTAPPTPEALAALLGGAFDVASVVDSTFPGPAAAPRALLTTLRRR